MADLPGHRGELEADIVAYPATVEQINPHSGTGTGTDSNASTSGTGTGTGTPIIDLASPSSMRAAAALRSATTQQHPLHRFATRTTTILPSTSRPVTPTITPLWSPTQSFSRAESTMTTANFRYIDPASYDPTATAPFKKPWSKVDGPGTSFRLADHERAVENIRGNESEFSTDTSGFAVYNSPAHETSFTDDAVVRAGYYKEVEQLLRAHLPGISKVVIFDHTIRRREKASPRQPVQQVHVDQTPEAAATRVKRHLPAAEADALLKRRYQIINVWRPIQNPASDFPLALVDWRSTAPEDLVRVDLLYPKRQDSVHDDDDDDRGKEQLPDPTSFTSTQGYEVRGETYAVAPSDKHKFYYMKDMTPEEVMFIKCFDSKSAWAAGGEGAVVGRAHCTPHTAFVDPQTPGDAPGRQSIEVRCLVFYE